MLVGLYTYQQHTILINNVASMLSLGKAFVSSLEYKISCSILIGIFSMLFNLVNSGSQCV